MRHRQLAVVAVALLAVLSGCASLGGGSGTGDGADLSADGAPTAGDTGAESGSNQGYANGGSESGANGGGDGAAAASVAAVSSGDRAIVRTGSVDLTVESFEATRNAIAAETRRFGGYVGGSSQSLHSRENDSWTTGQVVVRIPSDRFSELVSFVQGQGTVESVETDTEDVTDQLVELDARLTNLEAERDRLRSFYDRANSTSALLSIEERLSSVQGEIEQLEATKQSLEDRVALSTLRISIAEEPPEPADSTPDAEDPTVASAFLGSIHLLVDGGYALVLATAAAAPFAVVVGVPGAVGYGLYRRRRRNRSPPPAEPAAPPEDADSRREESPAEED